MRLRGSGKNPRPLRGPTEDVGFSRLGQGASTAPTEFVYY